MTRRILGWLLRHAWLVGLAGSLQPAQACPPDRPIAVVVPYAAGGSTDAVTRLLAQEVSLRLQRTVVVQNIAGASGLIAMRKLLSSPPDGCTLLSGSANTVLLVPLLNPQAHYQPADLRPLARVGSTEMVLLARSTLPARDLGALQAISRSAAQPLTAGHPGQESLQALALSQLAARYGLRLTEVPYSGAGPMLNDLAGSHLDLAVVAMPVALPLLAMGTARQLAIVDRLPGLEHLSSWAGWFSAAATPGEATQDVQRALHEALRDAQVAAQLERHGIHPAPPADQPLFAARVMQDWERLKADPARPSRPKP